jgi:hypothetical protein
MSDQPQKSDTRETPGEFADRLFGKVVTPT